MIDKNTNHSTLDCQNIRLTLKHNILLLFIYIFLLNNAFAAEQPDIMRFKSAETGVMLSSGATLIPVGIGLLTSGLKTKYVGPYIIIAGLAFGPDVGHFYAGQWGRGFLGIGFRGAISGISMLLIAQASAIGEYTTAYKIFWIGAGVVVAQIVWDIATVPNSVRRYNNSIQNPMKINFIPQLNIKRNIYGLKIVYNF
jgi:hypothetical protein